VIYFRMLHPHVDPEVLGFIPTFVSELDPRPAREQFDEHYAHGGGWHLMPHWALIDGPGYVIKYPGDRPLQPLALANFRRETICFYDGSFVAIFQTDGSFEVDRMD